MIFQFLRPVFAGDTVQCDETIVGLEPIEQYIRLSCQWVCRNQYGKEVLTRQAEGIVRAGTTEQ
jgi:acyl dehydratase